MATEEFDFATLTGSETAGWNSINALINSIDTKLDTSTRLIYMGDTTPTSGYTITWDSVNSRWAAGQIGSAGIANNAVELGTKTTGNYVATVAAAGTDEISVANSGTESAAVTVRLANNTALRGQATVETPPTYSGGSTGSTGRIPDAKYVTDALAYATAGNVTLAGDVGGSASANTIGSGKIYNNMINAAAAISYSKLNLTGAIQTSDLAFTLETNWGTAVTYTSGTTLLTSDQGKKFIQYNSSSAGTFTLSNSASYVVGCEINLMQIGTGQLTIQAGTNVSINGTPATTQGTGSSGSGTFKLRTQYSSATLIKRTTSTVDTWFIIGDLAV